MRQHISRLVIFGRKWVWKHKKFFVVLVIGFMIVSWIGIVPILIGTALLLLATAAAAVLLPDLRDTILEFLEEWVRKENEIRLTAYLEKFCMRCGYMDEKSWKQVLPWWYGVLPYESSFEEITQNFAAEVEKKYIECDEKLAWLDPVVIYLTKQVIADVAELEQVSNPHLEYTHGTPNAKLIYDAMNYLCIVKKQDGKFMIQRINLEEEAVRESLKLGAEEMIPEYYRSAYRINDYFVKKRKHSMGGNMVSEEISIEDL